MLLDFNGPRIDVSITGETSVASKHTGALLSVLTVRATVRGRRASEDLLSLISQATKGGVASVDDGGTIQKRWKIGNTSWTYQEGSPVYHHTIELTEMEHLNVSSLTIGSVTFQPYHYKETFLGDILRIEAKAVLSELQHNQLKAMQHSAGWFPVIRHGVNETPRQMQVVLGCWSQHDTEHKLQLFLTDGEQGQSDRNSMASAFSWARPLLTQTADNTVAIDLLLSALLRKNVLTENEVAGIRDEISQRSPEIRYGFFRVDDIDTL